MLFSIKSFTILILHFHTNFLELKILTKFNHIIVHKMVDLLCEKVFFLIISLDNNIQVTYEQVTGIGNKKKFAIISNLK